MTDLVLRRAGDAWRSLKGLDPVFLLILAIVAGIAALAPGDAGGLYGTAADAFLRTLPYILIAVGLIGYLKATGAEGILADAFKGRESRMVVIAALVGGMAPFCSCQVIPFIAALLAAGTPLSAVMAFWLSSPLIDPPQFVITVGALGMEFAVAKVVFAVALGLIGGFAVQAMTARGHFADVLLAPRLGGCCSRRLGGPPVWRFWTEPERRTAFRGAAAENLVFLGKWLGLAYLLEALLIRYVPAEAVAGAVGGDGVWPVVLGALVGAPAYLNGYAAPPLLAGLLEQGMSTGAAMAFMIAGAVSSIPAMAAVFALVRREVFALYLGFGIGGAILFGLIFGAVMG